MPVSPVGYQPVRVITAGDGPGVLVNRDITQQAIIGPNVSIFGSNPSSASILDPLVGIPFEGDTDIYAATLVQGAAINVDYILDAKNWTPSPDMAAQQIAALGLALETTQKSQMAPGLTIAQDIFGNGVPLYTKGQTLASNNVGVSVPSSTTITLYAGSVSQIGYEISINVQAPGATGQPVLRLLATWIESATGQTVAQEEWTVFSATAPNFQTYYGTGATKGDTLNLTILNEDTVQSQVVKFNLTQNSCVYTRDDWRQQTKNSVPGFTLATFDNPGNVFCASAPNVAAGSTVTRLLPLYAGRVTFTAVIPAANGTVNITDPDSTLGTSNVYNGPAAGGAGAVQNFQADLPRSNCLLSLTSAAGGGGIFNVFGTISEQQS